MHPISKLMVGSLLVATSSIAFAQLSGFNPSPPGQSASGSAQLKVIGTITPNACTLNLDNGGVIDYGNVSPSLMGTTLPGKSIGFNIVCTASTKIGLKSIDNRKDSRAGAMAVYSYGLGAAGDQNTAIGGYTLYVGDVRVNDKAAAIVGSVQGRDWNKLTSSTNGVLFKADEYISWSAHFLTTPGSQKNVSGSFRVVPELAKSSTLDIKQDIKMDGSATIELVYL